MGGGWGSGLAWVSGRWGTVGAPSPRLQVAGGLLGSGSTLLGRLSNDWAAGTALIKDISPETGCWSLCRGPRLPLLAAICPSITGSVTPRGQCWDRREQA